MLTHPITPMRRAASAGMIIVLLLSSLLTACQGAPAPAAQPSAVAAAPTSTSAPPTATPEPAATATPTPQPTATPTEETPQGGEIVEGFRVYEATSGKTTVHVLIQADYVKPADAGHKPYFDTLSSVAGVQGLVDLIEAYNELAKEDGYWTGGEDQIDITFRLVESVLLDEASALEKSELGELDYSHSDMFRVYEKIDENSRKITIIFDRDLDKPNLRERGLNLVLFVYTRGTGGYGKDNLLVNLGKLLDEGNQEKIDRSVAAAHAINDYLEGTQQ